jgi:poly-gamma-glutamate capsule biosynthesis protein CapA/YwtB (metallophosphatase superfamily)
MFIRFAKIVLVLSLLLAIIYPFNNKTVKAKVMAPVIRVTFAGDLMLDWSVKTTTRKYGSGYPFKQVKAEVSNSDLAVANLETAVTNRNAMFPKTYNFKADPAATAGVKNAGFDLVSLANNHSMDYKREGLLDTLAELKKHNLSYIGAGKNSVEAYRAKRYTIKGKKVSFIAFSKVIPDTSWIAQSKRAGVASGYNLNTILQSIKRESAFSDYVFVYLHWGIEMNKRPDAYQRTWAKRMIDAGADGVVGSHSHVLQGFEYYKGKPIAYSLGNFLFPNYVRGDKAQTGLLHFDIQSGKIGMSFTPYYIYNDQIRKKSTATKKQIWRSLQSLSYGIKIDNNGKILKK